MPLRFYSRQLKDVSGTRMEYTLEPFSTRRNFSCGTIISFVFDAHSPVICLSTKENSAPHGKFRLVENGLEEPAMSLTTLFNTDHLECSLSKVVAL